MKSNFVFSKETKTVPKTRLICQQFYKKDFLESIEMFFTLE